MPEKGREYTQEEYANSQIGYKLGFPLPDDPPIVADLNNEDVQRGFALGRKDYRTYLNNLTKKAFRPWWKFWG
ncbi:MAG: hypothetical protein J2P37_00315 [Ktedonobacteraceae bacterium]|nr:hypothetical protein [Ktedonobacteraceae bacterium]